MNDLMLKMNKLEGVSIGHPKTAWIAIRNLFGCISQNYSDYKSYHLYITKTHLVECDDAQKAEPKIWNEVNIRAFQKRNWGIN